jgi:hypothetical protein
VRFNLQFLSFAGGVSGSYDLSTIGNYTYNVPSMFNTIEITLVAGGGAGAVDTQNNVFYGLGGGGGSGQFSTILMYGVSGQQFNFIVGAGAQGWPTNNYSQAGSNGDSTIVTFGSNFPQLISFVLGGNGGLIGNSVNLSTVTGGPGGPGFYGGGGGAAFNSSSGNAPGGVGRFLSGLPGTAGPANGTQKGGRGALNQIDSQLGGSGGGPYGGLGGTNTTNGIRGYLGCGGGGAKGGYASGGGGNGYISFRVW